GVARPTGKTRALVRSVPWQRNLRRLAPSGRRRFRRQPYGRAPDVASGRDPRECPERPTLQVARSATESRDPQEKLERSSDPWQGRREIRPSPKWGPNLPTATLWTSAQSKSTPGFKMPFGSNTF